MSGARGHDRVKMETTVREQQQKEHNTIQNCFKKNKIFRNKPNRRCKDLYSENYMTLKEETDEDTNKWMHILCSWIGIINIIKMSILPKAIYRFNVNPTQIPMVYFTELKQIFQNFMWTYKRH